MPLPEKLKRKLPTPEKLKHKLLTSSWRWTKMDERTDRGNIICPFHHFSNGGGIKSRKEIDVLIIMVNIVHVYTCTCMRDVRNELLIVL